MKEFIWNGVYSSFKEVPAEGPGFKGEKWLNNSLKKITALRNAAKENTSVPSVTKYRESLLPVVASMVYNEMGRVRILDFGGGIGFTFYEVAQALPKTENFEYHIVGTEAECTAGRHSFMEEGNIFFHNSLPEDIGEVDIVHMGSSLHYIEKWRETLARLCGYSPEYLLFTDLTAGDIPTYASAQKYYDSSIPVWFFNLEEIIEAMFNEGFKLVFKSTYVSKILGEEQPLPQDNFKEEYRLGYSCILLFGKGRNK
ncbi:MAG: methyltransferase, TIGR04325 family [Planctomycetota bacterium]|jgi:putative methyltransferase (TIGR04325 family)